MWTNKNRARYDRSKLRYPSDLTDEEWGLVEPLIPPGKTGGGKRRVIMREVVNGLMYVLSTGVSGGRFRKTCPREARSMATSICGHMTARWNEFTARFMSSVANESSGKPVRPPPSSTARA
jgi:hypothetical protein